jgi:dipeptidyl-peptidase 4
MRQFLTFSGFFLAIALIAQERLTIAHTADATFRARSVQSVNWMKDGQFYSALANNQIVKYDVTTGQQVEVIVDGGTANIKIDGYTFNDTETQVLLMSDQEYTYRRSFTANYHLYDVSTKTVSPFSSGRLSYATFSPDGKKIAFVRDNNLFYVDLTTNKETAVTTDGRRNEIINGSSDWVYEEELYITKAFEWSADSKKLAWIRFDESRVKEYNMQLWKDGALYPEDYRYKYPKAGEDNSLVEVLIFNLDDTKKTRADIGAETDIYIPRIYWTKNPNVLSVQRLNRLQNQLDILHVDATSGKSTPVLRETSPTYIDFTFCDDLKYLDNGTQFLYSSERSGYKHFYLYDMSGKLIRQITNGNFEATDLVRLRQGKSPVLYYMSTEVSPLERHLYSIGLDGKNKKRLTMDAGVSRINMSPDTKYYMNYHSAADKVMSVTLFMTEGNKKLNVLQDNAALTDNVKKFNLAPKEFFTMRTPEGVELNGFFLKPTDFDTRRKYPVLVFQYSGPGSQQVANSFGGGHFIWHQYLAQQGYVVAVIDPRGTGYRGESFKKMTYKELGKLETEDMISAGRWLGEQPWVDKTRIGIWGWSYGGYMSSLVLMKGADVFKAAIAVAPVTTWRYYDTIYTERYLQRPQDNPSGYDDNSPNTHVDKLKGRLLLIHGTGDDNVHFQNAVALQNQLIKGGKQFSSFYYPDLAHGLGYRGHLYQMMTEFILDNL